MLVFYIYLYKIIGLNSTNTFRHKVKPFVFPILTLKFCLSPTYFLFCFVCVCTFGFQSPVMISINRIL